MGVQCYHKAWKFLRLLTWSVLGKSFRCGWTGPSALDLEKSVEEEHLGNIKCATQQRLTITKKPF